MDTENYVVSIKTRKGGRIVLKTSDKCHKAKSFAGTVFHSDGVESVYVGDIKGNHYLYLVKDHPEKYENVPSAEAIFG
jgi:hypothetical protein